MAVDDYGNWVDDPQDPNAGGGTNPYAGTTLRGSGVYQYPDGSYIGQNGKHYNADGTEFGGPPGGDPQIGGPAPPGGPLLPPPPPPPDGGGGGGGSSSAPNNAGFQWPTYQLPTPYQFTPFNFDSYTPLTADQASQEPGYAFARDQGRDAIQTSAAAKGNVLSGAALKDLFSWGDQFAGQNYQNAETRNENVYKTNRDNAFNNWAGNQAGGLASWQANNQPGQFQFASGLQPQAALTFNDLFQRFKTGVDATTAIATAGAN